MAQITQMSVIGSTSRPGVNKMLPVYAMNAVIGANGQPVSYPEHTLYAFCFNAAPGIGNFQTLINAVPGKGIALLHFYVMFSAASEIRCRYGGTTWFDFPAVANVLYQFNFGEPGLMFDTVNQVLDVGNPFAPAANITAGCWYSTI